MKEKGLSIHPGTSISDFLSPKLAGSTLSVRKISEEEFYVESDGTIQIHLNIDTKAKKLFENLYSPKWGRPVIVQQIDGNEFLELQAEQELLKEHFEEVADDVLLAVDLVKSWAKASKLTVVEMQTREDDRSQVGKKATEGKH